MTRVISRAEWLARQASATAAAPQAAAPRGEAAAPQAAAPLEEAAAPQAAAPLEEAAAPQAAARLEEAAAPQATAPREEAAALPVPGFAGSGPILPGEARAGSGPLPWSQNPPPDSRSPAEWVISEATAVAMLTRFYGWVALDAGTLRRTRKPQPMAMLHHGGEQPEDETVVPVAAAMVAPAGEAAAADRAA